MKITNKTTTLIITAILSIPVFAIDQRLNTNTKTGVNLNKNSAEMENRINDDKMKMRATTSFNNERRTLGGKSIGGLITKINSDSFLIATPSRNGTTTITIVTDSDTKFRSGTSTSKLDDLYVGQRVSTYGIYSTSTLTLQAEQVLIINKPGQENKNGKPGFFGRIIGWFKNMF